ncbi:OLC1v1038669C4 [Oldenlandia corymbosa var. corymbosa]|uniref:OLC1v1038669C4 n=1 Tax=Oldenlandia corymbosa var. corymbosa TaxID=529605 RepID=A0AAV1D0Y0_OLDCO|nr:OLC1v1038669C4 [Oldenlandia corymbosa var. corymbosa]
MAGLFSQTQTTFYNGIKIRTLPSFNASSDFDISINFPSVSKLKGIQQLIPSRRFGNYQPPHWDFHFVQSLKNESTDKTYVCRFHTLKEKAKMDLNDEMDPLNQLEFIEDLQTLGVSYHFRHKIQSILSTIYESNYKNSGKILPNGEDLYATALGFRLMRQHGFEVVQDVFNCFKDEKGNFKANLCKDIRGMLQLYEASYFERGNERTLELARKFARKHLKKSLEEKEILDLQLALLVERALELPLHWRVPRVDARWFMDLYDKRVGNKNSYLVEFAKLDFNLVQATHQNDLKDSSRWWEMTCLGSKLDFVRDRLVENFFWTIAVNFENESCEGSYFRIMSTKVNALITVIDDIYDVYGTLDELELFTSAVERWNVDVIDELPGYMKICYLALHNTINEIANDAMKEQGALIIPYLRKAWGDLCRSYLQEAKWYHSGYTPNLQEYLDNAWVSISGPLILVHAYFLVSTPITSSALQSLHPYHNIIRYSAMILRLANDLGTSKVYI